MNLEPTAEQQAIRQTVRDLVEQQRPGLRSLLDDDTGTTAENWEQLTGIGATGLLVPEHLGGSGLGMAEAAIVLEELGAGLYPGPFLSTAVAAPRALARFSTNEEAAALLTGIADGSLIVTVGGLDPAEDPLEEDDGQLTGRVDVPDAAAADVVLLPAGGGLWAVERADLTPVPDPGIDLTHQHFTVELDHVAARNLAGTGDWGAVVDDVLLARAADAVGAADAVLHLTLAHARTRHQFGRPIGTFQAVQHLCADMYESVELARSGLLYGLWTADQANRAEHHRAAIRLKAFSGRLATVADTAIQVLGGLGFTWEHDAHLYLRRLLGWSAYLGRPERYLQEAGALLEARTHGTKQEP